ncbi:MAG: tRNA (adenosine(37)-N6)-threonylcarbamoyltransferase complex dimerization subunit type 1 TsaB [Armatimonadota bacterium]|nr:tRNA (adenosine(37)-N6)-threonylcarbamoyltransferase complex dimerization subunit type 1 TsaB [Armatimonadota bacterium]
MIGTSSPVTSVAVFDNDLVLAALSENAPMRASGATMRLLAAALAGAGITKGDVEVWAADLGPGSFTGVKVGVTIAKTLAFALGTRVAGFSAFDLINRSAAAVPSRKGMYLVRDQDGTDELPFDHPRVVAAKKYGGDHADFPAAENAALLFSEMELLTPEAMLPNYVLEPNISKPKDKFGPVQK